MTDSEKVEISFPHIDPFLRNCPFCGNSRFTRRMPWGDIKIICLYKISHSHFYLNLDEVIEKELITGREKCNSGSSETTVTS